ncbi:Uma2 family endonuclease [Streptomyces sp. JV176]|uniref:Uma2 family endonuclease n=1 Tax=Streptomyces sp. JV176 TaxID=858630 RepID=UPI002E7688D0|nr:Uma2 family endonuclease [Streptomyces sp. JV176]MEE1799806.1 Uma2 family endonuclease [Streptomyces sp. JV176]
MQERCIQARPDVWLYAGGELGIEVEAYREGRAKPDAILAPRKTFLGQGDWSDASRVLMVVEVTSYDWDTDRRDRKEKPSAYAAAGIPIYLLVDRDHRTVTVHSDPTVDGYGHRHVADLGKKILLPRTRLHRTRHRRSDGFRHLTCTGRFRPHPVDGTGPS